MRLSTVWIQVSGNSVSLSHRIHPCYKPHGAKQTLESLHYPEATTKKRMPEIRANSVGTLYAREKSTLLHETEI